MSVSTMLDAVQAFGRNENLKCLLQKAFDILTVKDGLYTYNYQKLSEFTHKILPEVVRLEIGIHFPLKIDIRQF